MVEFPASKIAEVAVHNCTSAPRFTFKAPVIITSPVRIQVLLSTLTLYVPACEIERFGDVCPVI